MGRESEDDQEQDGLDTLKNIKQNMAVESIQVTIRK